MERPSWDKYFLAMAQVASTRSTCSRRQVGAVLVDADTHRVLGTGYNGAVPGAGHCVDGHCPRGRQTYEDVPAFSSYSTGEGRCIAVHAEINALHNAGSRGGKSMVMYVTCPPCPECAARLAEERIHVKYPQEPAWT